MFLLRSPNPDADAGFRDEVSWVRHYVCEANTPGKLVLDHARARYQDVQNSFQGLNDRAMDLLRTAGLLAMILLAAAKAFEFAPSWSVRSAFCCFLAAMIVLIWSRRAITFPAIARVRDLLESAADVENPEAWLGASMHEVIEAIKIVNRWKAAWLNLGNWLICLGIACLLPLIFFWR